MSTCSRLPLLLAGFVVLASCAPELHELNLARREGRPYIPRIVHPAFPADSLHVDPLLAERQALWNDLEALLSPKDVAALGTAPDSVALTVWLAEFWRPLDPVTTTEANERRQDHTQRIALARQLYPSEKAPYYDARGRALIRFGQPEAVLRAEAAVTGTSYEAPVEVWRVRDMVLGFQSFANSGEFAPSGMPRAREGLFVALAGGSRQSLAMLENGELMRGSGEVLYEHHLAGRPLWLAASVDFYQAAAADSTLMRVFYQLRHDELGVDAGWGGPVHRFEHALALAKPGTGRRHVGRGEEWVAAGDSAKTFLAGRVEQVVGAGRFELTLHLRDRIGDGEQIYRQTFDVPRFPVDSLALSDISLFRAEGEPRYDFEILGAPHPSAAYRQGTKLALYNEVYGLDTSGAGRHDCSLRYTIRARGRPTVSSSFRDLAAGASAVSSLIIDTGTLAAGDYTLVVEAVDERAKLFAIVESDYRATRSRSFRVLAAD